VCLCRGIRFSAFRFTTPCGFATTRKYLFVLKILGVTGFDVGFRSKTERLKTVDDIISVEVTDMDYASWCYERAKVIMGYTPPTDEWKAEDYATFELCYKQAAEEFPAYADSLMGK
jgi:hypothetical protein